ncbi:tyrosine-type recombinase/integrase [Dactylosporangium sp. NPDC051541]|uniref:tyrosine-type recombinase/integrase n=1 Tax=Dactylosporangium sp. NPDC051541 TaxID=3363977 RepID=UPI00379EBCAA
MSKQKGSKNPNGEGTIYQRPNGTWAGVAHVLTTDGTMKRKTVYGKTWEQAHEKLVELKAKSHRGVPSPDRSWKVDEYLRYWLQVYASGLRPKTYEGYESAVRNHLIPALGRRRLTGLQVQHVRAFLDAFKQSDSKPSVRQVQYVHAVLRNALQHAMREELLARNVATLVKVTSPRYKVGKGLDVEQVKALLKAAQGHRLYALYIVAATMGLRRGELLGLRWEDIDLDNGTITIEMTVQRAGGKLHIQDTKTESSESVLPLPEITRKTLQQHQDMQAKERVELAEAWKDHGLVFPSEVGTPMEPRNLARHFAGLRERAGITDVRLHDFRHTVVTVLMELGVPPHIVQAIARHSDVKLTLKIYAHSNLAEMRKALDKIDTWLS